MKNDLTVHDKTASIAKAVRENDNARVILDRFLVKMSRRGIEYTQEEQKLMLLTFHLFMEERQFGTPVVVALPPSFGKSTALEEFGVYMVQHAPLFGMVVVKDERKQVLEYEKEINERIGKKVAYSLLGKTDAMTQSEYRNQFDEQKDFPILVMTKAMFQKRSEMKDLERFAFWTNKQTGATHRRSQLILDEPPAFETTGKFDSKKLTHFLELVRQFSFRADGKQDGYYKEIQKKVAELRAILEDESIETGFIPVIDSSFSLPEKLKREWAFKYEGNEGNLLVLFETLVRRGGYKLQNEKECSVSASYDTFLDWTAFNPLILDGTGHIDLDYKKFGFPTLSLVEEEGKYKHVKMLHYSTGGSFSKTAIRKKKKTALKKIAEIVREIASRYLSTMVVCHKEFYEELSEELRPEIGAGEIKLRWFNNGRSSNEYDKCDSAIFIGELNKGEQYYHSIAQLRNEKVKAGFKAGKGGFKFADEKVKEIWVNDAFIQRVQDMQRLRARNRKCQLDFYFIGKNDELLELLEEHFSGSSVEEFKPQARGLTKDNSTDRFTDWLKEFASEPSGTKVKAKEVYSGVLGIKDRQYRLIKKDAGVLELMAQLGVCFKGQSIERR